MICHKTKELKKAYNAGYRTGRNWNNEWMPGGPYVCCDFSKKVNQKWKKGFDAGLKFQQSCNSFDGN